MKRRKTISFRLPGDDPAEIARFERETSALRIPLDPDPETAREMRLLYLVTRLGHPSADPTSWSSRPNPGGCR